MAVFPNCFEESANGEMQTQLARARLLVDHHMRSRRAIASISGREEIALRGTGDVSRVPRLYRKNVQLWVEIETNILQLTGSGDCLSRVRPGRSPRSTMPPARNRTARATSYRAHLQSLAVWTGMKKGRRRTEPPGQCEPICDCHLSAKRRSACDHWTGTKTRSD